LSLVALTFDDGPSDWTEPILDALAEHGAHATFFVIGAHVAGRERLLRRMNADGHGVGNHTFDHVNLTAVDDVELAAQIDRGRAAIVAALGFAPRLFRAPFFRKDDVVLDEVERQGHVDVGADVYPLDWDPGVDADTIVERVIADVGPRSIVCLHDGVPPNRQTPRTDCTSTVEAVRRLLPALRDRGYACVSVTELFSWSPAPSG
jgi:peptidoglycan/xylan/chitin deacetylase (PgdA/CDA1 family)